MGRDSVMFLAEPLVTPKHSGSRVLRALWALLFLLPVPLGTSQAWAQTTVSGAIATDTTWTLTGSPYLVSSAITLQNGAVLTIDAGVTVYMGLGTGLTVQAGAIKALGTASTPIRVLSDNARSGAPAAPGDWDQWIFMPGTVNTRLEHVLFEHGKGLAVNGSAPVFNYLELRNHQGAAITIDLAASPSGVGNQASGNTVNGVAVPAGDITGSVSWTLRGIPYVVTSGAVSVGASPVINAVTPNRFQQGDTVTLHVTGTRLAGAALARFEANGLSAQILPGATSTQLDISVAAAAGAVTGATGLTLLVDAGEIRVPAAITVERSRPTITSFDPAALFVTQGPADVLVNGRNFTAQSSVLVNGTPVTTQFISPARLRASIANQDTTGTLLVRVNAPDPLNAGQFLISDEAGLPVRPRQDLRIVTWLGGTSTVAGKGMRTDGLELFLQRVVNGNLFAGTDPVTVTLSVSDGTKASAPATVTIPANVAAINFTVAGIELTAGTPVTVNASAPDYLSPTTKLSLQVISPTPTINELQGLRSTASLRDDFYVGTVVPGAVFPNGQTPVTALPVNLSIVEDVPAGLIPGFYNSQIGGATVTQAVIPAGVATNTGSRVYVGQPTAPGTYKVRAEIPAGNSAVSELQTVVLPQLLIRTYLGTSNTVVGKGMRSPAIELTVSRAINGVPFAGADVLVVNLACASAATCAAPATVTIPANQATVNFTLDGLAVGSTTLVATAPGFNPGPTFTVDVIAPQLSFTGPSATAVGAQSSFTLKLSVPGAIFPADQVAVNPITVNLSSSSPGVATVPATVTIPAGSSVSPSVAMTAVNAGTITLTASGSGLASATTAPLSVTAACLVPPSGMVGWWSGDGSAIDRVGTNNGTLQNGATFAAGKVGQAFSLDGANDYVDLGSSPAFDLTDFTIHTWISVDPATNTGERRVLGRDDYSIVGSVQSYGIKSSSPAFCGDGRPLFAIGKNNIYTMLCSPTVLSAGFHHLAGVRDGATVSFYVDGALVATQSSPVTGVISPAAPFVLGRVNPSYPLEFFNGLIDEVAMHNRALTASEIAGVYAAGGNGMCTQCQTPPTELAGWWTGDGTANDKAGANNGTLQNGATFAAGKVGQAFSLDGVDDYVNLGSASAFDLADFTIHAWVSIDSATNTGERRIVSRDDVSVAPGGRQLYTLKSSSPDACGGPSGRPVLAILRGGLGVVCGPSALSSGFHHLAGVRSGTTLSLYVDGALVASQATGVSGTIAPTAPLVIGQVSPAFNGEYFVGLVDEVAIHRRALTASEIAAVFGAGGNGMCKQCQPPAAGTVDWWPAEGTMNDIAGTNPGTPSGGVTFTAGRVGNAAAFDGVNGVVNFGASAGNFGAADFSMHFWIKTSSTRTEGIIGKRSVCDHANMWDMRMFGGRLTLELDQSGSNYLPIATSRAINDNVFHHVAIVRQGATVAIYIDGILDVTGSSGIANVDSGTNLIAGRSACTGFNGEAFFTGVLDELTLVNRALSAGEIQAVVTSADAGICRAQCAALPANAVSWWAGEGNTNDTVDSNTAVWEGAAAYAPGVNGQAFKLDGASRVRVPNAPNLRISRNDFSIEAWVRFDGLSGDMSIVDAIAGGANADGWRLLKQADNRFWFCFGGGTNHCFDSAYTLFSTTRAQTGVFYHLMVVKTASQFALYVNGVREDMRDAVPDFVDSQTADLRLGGSAVEGAYLIGLIDEAKVYARALSASEIQALVRAAGAGICRTQCAALPASPLSWWKAEGNASDAMNLNPGSLQGGITFTPGKVGQAFSLDGIDDHVVVNYNPSLDPGTGSFSLDAWVKTSKSTGRQVIISRYECGQLCLSNVSTSAYLMYVTDGVLQAFLRDSDPTNGLSLTGTKFIADNAFHHVALVRDIPSGTLRIYVDGVLDGSAPLAPAADGAITDNDNDPDPLVIGASVVAGQSTKEQFFSGVIDEVRYHSRALTNLDVNAIFQADKAGVCVP